MGSVWGLALLLFFCWEAGVSGSSTAENKGTLTTSPAPQTRETPTTSPSAETTSLTKIINSNFMGDIINPMDTHDTRGSPKGSGTSTVGTSIGSDPTEVTFDTLPTEDSSEEARRIVIDLLTLAHTFTETESLFSDSSYPSKSSVPVLSTSQALSPAVPIPPKILMTYHTTHIEISNYSLTEIEIEAIITGTSDTDHSPTEVTALSTSETSALSPSREADSHISKTTAFADALSIASAKEPAIPATTFEDTLSTSDTTERKTTATKASTLSESLVTVSRNPLEETLALSVEIPSHAEMSSVLTGSTEAGSAVGKVTSLAGPSASTSSPSEVAPIKNFTYSETFDTDSTTIGSFPISRRLPPSVHLTSANSSRDRNITLAKATTSPRTPMKPPTSTPTTAWVKQTTGVSVGTLGTLTTSSTAETTSLSKIITSNLTIDIITRGSPTGHGTSTVRTGTGSNSTEVMFDTLPTRVSTEETKKIMVDQLTQAHTSKEAESLSSESSSSSNSLAPALTTSQALSPDIWIPVKTLVAYSTAHIEPTNYSTEIETASPTFRTSDTDQRSTEGVTALSTSETSALPPSTEAKSHIPKATAFADASESASPATTLEATLPTSCTTERKTTATKASTHSGALGTVTSNPFKETSDPSVETSSHAEVSGSTEAGSAVGKVTSLAGPSASTSSPSEVAPIENFTYSVTFDTDSTTIGSFPISRRLPPSVHPTLANSSRDRNITSAKATTSPRTPMKPPTSMPTTASVKQTTGVSASGDGGFLLVRLSVASPEDLTEPRLAERLMKQLRYELRIHVPLVQVSLLRVKRV
uniref:Mucin-20 n=1 Tax=Castor canadensis TaxID=51338 RepID=A0A8B7W8D7_CASCN|nr:mucin-20 [Castor canadensis]